MYSVVLMTALTAGSAAPNFCHSGGYGCYCSCYGGSYCGNYGGCWYGGGWGGWCGGHGCHYGPYGACYGCYSGSYACYGCYGAYATYGGNYFYGSYGCHGCSGCHDAAWTFSGYGCAGPGHYWAGGPPYVIGTCGGCYGCHGGYSGYGMPVPGSEQMVPRKDSVDPFPPVNPPKKDGKPEVVPLPEVKPEPKKEVEEILLPKDKKQQSRAKIRIEVPVDGTLYVDDQLIRVPAGTRLFQTPPLAPGQKYFYDVRIVTVRNGQTQSEQRRVILESGQDIAVSFPNLSPRGAYVQATE